jgi:hypothetical protein
VGSEEELFMIHKDVVCASSKFFKAACSQRWIEGKEKKVTLPEMEPKVFQDYVAWLYSRAYQLQASKGDADPEVHDALQAAIELYLLGDVLDDIRLRNKIVQVLVTDDLELVPGSRTLHQLWARTTPASLLRKMYVVIFTRRVDREEFAKIVASYPAELVQEIAVAALKQTERINAECFISKLAIFLEPVPEDG